MSFAAVLRISDHRWSKQQMWSEHLIINSTRSGFNLVEAMAQRGVGVHPGCTWQGVRKGQWYAPGSVSLQEGAATAGGWRGSMAQTAHRRNLDSTIFCAWVLLDPLVSSFLEKTEFQTCICLNRTGLFLFISKILPVFHRGWQKVTHKIFPPKRLARTWCYRATCHVLCCFLPIWNR